MKVLEFKGKMSARNKTLICLTIIFIIFIASIVTIYLANEEARDWINIHILRKSITEDDVATINLDTDKSQYVTAHDRYISVLCNGKLSIYNSYASKEAELEVSISNPICQTNGSYLVMAEKNGERLYLIEGNKILWDTKIEGKISKVNISKSGLVSIIITGTSYKSVIAVFDKTGKELFEQYLVSAIAVDTDISIDGKNLAIAKVNTGGALVESSIEITDIEKASKGGEENTAIYKYNADKDKIITDIKYQEKGQLVCIYNDSIHIINNDKESTILEFDENTQIADINLKSYIVRAEKIATGTFTSKTNIILTNIITRAETIYEVKSSIKEIKCYNEIAAINIGTEIHFIGLNGWLEKKYTSNQEAKEIVLGTQVAGIVYRDRIKIITI